MKDHIKILLLVFGLMWWNDAYSQMQGDRLVKVGYGAGIPFGGLAKYVQGKTYDGLSVDFKYFIKDNISLGLSSGWNSFSKQFKREVYYFPNGEVSAVQTRYFRSIPVLLTGHYYFNQEGAKFIPYAGMGLGAYVMHYEKWYGVFPEVKAKWSFGGRPEAGILLPLSEKIGLDINLRYNIAAYSYQDITDFHYGEASLGLYIYLY